jgi:hypothetical protein
VPFTCVAVEGTTLPVMLSEALQKRCAGLSALVALVVSGCAHGGIWQNPGKLPPDAIVLPVAGLRQVDNRCGPNALTMVLNAAGDPIEEAAVAAAILNKRADATLSLDLLLFARKRDFPADFESGSIERLMALIEAGQPAILLLNLEPGVPWPMKGRPLWHYVVVYGVSASRRAVLLHSGVGPKRISFDRLLKIWKPGGFWMMHLGKPIMGTSLCP